MTTTLPAFEVRTCEQADHAPVCPMCGQARAEETGDFVALVRVRGKAYKLADPLELGGRRVYFDGKSARTQVVPILVVEEA